MLGPPRSNALNPCTIPAQVSPALAARLQRLLVAGQQDEAFERARRVAFGAGRTRRSPADGGGARSDPVGRGHGGLGTVAELAERVGLSVRQLERQFRDQVGMSPKSLSRLTRFEAAQHRIFETEALSFTRLAHELGYADQAHFTREFRAFAAQSPGGFRAEVKEFLRRQGGVAFVQAERAVAS